MIRDLLNKNMIFVLFLMITHLLFEAIICTIFIGVLGRARAAFVALLHAHGLDISMLVI
jgi:hypothetical protein